MIINVRVIPKSSRTAVMRVTGGFKVYLTKPAEDGQANEQLVKVLLDFLKLKPYQVKIIKGQKSRDKLVEIDV